MRHRRCSKRQLLRNAPWNHKRFEYGNIKKMFTFRLLCVGCHVCSSLSRVMPSLFLKQNEIFHHINYMALFSLKRPGVNLKLMYLKIFSYIVFVIWNCSCTTSTTCTGFRQNVSSETFYTLFFSCQMFSSTFVCVICFQYTSGLVLS